MVLFLYVLTACANHQPHEYFGCSGGWYVSERRVSSAFLRRLHDGHAAHVTFHARFGAVDEGGLCRSLAYRFATEQTRNQGYIQKQL